MQNRAKINISGMLRHSLFLSSLAFLLLGSLFVGVSKLAAINEYSYSVTLPVNSTVLLIGAFLAFFAIIRKHTVLMTFSVAVMAATLFFSSTILANDLVINSPMPWLQQLSWLCVMLGLLTRFKVSNLAWVKLSWVCFSIVALLAFAHLLIDTGALGNLQFAANPIESLNMAIFLLFTAIAGLAAPFTFHVNLKNVYHSIGSWLGLLLTCATLLLWLNFMHQLDVSNQEASKETILRIEQQTAQTLEAQQGLMQRLGDRLAASNFTYQAKQINLDFNTYLRDFSYLEYIAVLDSSGNVHYSVAQTAANKSWYDNHVVSEFAGLLDKPAKESPPVTRFFYNEAVDHAFVSLQLRQPNALGLSTIVAGINFAQVMQSKMPIIVPTGYAITLRYESSSETLLSQLEPTQHYTLLSEHTIDSLSEIQWRLQLYRDYDIGINYERHISQVILLAGWLACLLALLMQQYQQQFQWQHKKLIATNNRLTHSLEQQQKLKMHHLQFMENSADLLCIIDAQGKFVELSDSCSTVLGYTAKELEGKIFIDFVHPDDRQQTEIDVQQTITDEHTHYCRNRYYRKNGDVVHLMWSAQFVPEMNTMYAIARDISEQVKGERYQQAQQNILELISIDASQAEILEQICLMAEAHNPAVKACVMLKVEQQLQIASGPSLSPQYHHAVSGIAIADKMGSCGTAAFHNKLVITEDFAQDPNWDDYLEIVIAEGVSACWSLPMVVKQDNVLGTFALYCKEARAPSEEELELLRSCCRFAANAIERAKQKRLISESEQRFRSLYQFNPDPVYVLDHQGYFSTMNTPGLELLQRPLQELKQMHFAEVIVKQQLPQVTAYFNSALAGNPESFEVTVSGFSGELYELQITITPTWIDGKVVGVIGIAKDITQRLQTQRQLKLFKRAVDASSNGVVISDITQSDMPVTYVNSGFEKITGYSQADIQGKNCRFLQGKERDELSIKQIREAIASRQEVSVTLKNYRKDGSGFWNHLFLSPVPDDDGVITHYIGIQTDITEQKNYEQELAFNASHDLLTGLPNRGLLRDRLSQSVKISSRHAEQVAILFIDLDGFKLINDSLGHSVGDEVICEVSARINHLIRSSDTLARMGGDEFVLMLPDLKELNQTNIMAERILKTISQPIVVSGKELQLTASIGVSIADTVLNDPMELVKRADLAMYRAKQLGRNNIQWYNPEMEETLNKRLSLRAMLKQALENQEFELYYQPQVAADSGRIIGLEALLRWQHPEHGFIGPDEFIPVAEEMGLIVELGQWVIEQAACYNRSLQQRGLAEVIMAVNLSSLQFQRTGFVEQLKATLNQAKLAPQWFELELTESLLLDNVEQVVDKLQHLKQLGISIAIDDFGTGYSSLNYLKRLPLDKLKIDKSFINELDSDQKDAAITRAIIAMGHELDLHIIAEGVETLSQATLLKTYGCNELQGYFYAKPLPAAQLEVFIKQYNADETKG